MDVVGEIKDPELIIERWPGFAPTEDEDGTKKPNRLIGHKRVHFTEEAIVVELRQRVMLLDGSETTSLTITEPCTRDLLAMDALKGSIAKSASLLSSVANIKPSEIAKIKAADFLLLNEVVNGFLSDVLQISGT
jgi:hypothetical protein